MLTSEFLRDKIGLEFPTQEFDQLVSTKLDFFRVFGDMDEVRAEIHEATPFYFLPIMSNSGDLEGVILHPAHVANKRFVLSRGDPTGDTEGKIEAGDSFRYYIYRELLKEDINGYIKASDVANANQVFGADFYEKGRHGEIEPFGEEAAEIMVEVFGGSAYDYSNYGDSRPPGTNYHELVQQGVARWPHSMFWRCQLTQYYNGQGEGEAAARAFVSSLSEYHYTCYTHDLEEHYKLGQELLSRYPEVLPADALIHFDLYDFTTRTRDIVGLSKQGQTERALKMFHDMCYDAGSFDYQTILKYLRGEYEKLGWEWALTLCDLSGEGLPDDQADSRMEGQIIAVLQEMIE